MSLRDAASSFRGALPQYLKYQIVTKLLLGFVLVPAVMLLVGMLVHASGEGAVSSANIGSFLLSPQGAAVGALLLALIFAAIVLELFGFITIEARHRAGLPESGYRDLLLAGLAASPRLLTSGGLGLLGLLVLAVPLTGIGPGVSVLDGVRVPNFVMSVIQANPLFATLYAVAVAALGLLALSFVYTFHFIVLGELTAGRAMGASVRMLLRHWRLFLREALLPGGLLALAALVVAVLWGATVALLPMIPGQETALGRILMVFLLLVQQMVLLAGSLLLPPLGVHLLSRAFVASAAADERFAGFETSSPQVPAKPRPSLLDRLLDRKRTLAILLTVALALLAVPLGVFAHDLLHDDADIRVVGHRAGGSAAPENSMSGLRYAIEQGTWAVEIDIHRTLDGQYVLNHDDTFQRAAGDPRTPQELTLAEAQQLDISIARDGSEHPVGLREFLLAARDGGMRVLVELKGVSADERMVDDVIALAEELGVRESIVLISLKDNLIQYSERTRPWVETGFLYFLSLGDPATLSGDYLIMEEREASTGTLLELQLAGKRPIVWTVNSAESIDRFAGEPVFGVITDEIAAVEQVLAERRSASVGESILRLFGGS